MGRDRPRRLPMPCNWSASAPSSPPSAPRVPAKILPENGKVMLRAAQLEHIQSVLKMGKREAQVKLQG